MTVDNEDVLSTAVIGIWEGVFTGKFYFSDETYDRTIPFPRPKWYSPTTRST